MEMSPSVADFWDRFRAVSAAADLARFYEAFYFGDSEELANSLADLVLQGVKRATTGSLWSFEHEGKRPPRLGDLSIVTNWSGSPLCVIETTKVDVVPFKEVSAEFAAIEGEGDGSLEYWREGHKAYFSRECTRMGRAFSEDILVACEQFRVVFVGSQSAP
jgi:uncharacterized protein YhfF